jgi:hypothetical protein
MDRGYIIGVKTLDTLEFQFLPRVREKRNLTFAEIPVVGANNSIFNATGGSADLTLDIGFYINDNSREDVIKAIRTLEAFTYTGGNGNDIETVQIVLGKLYKGRKYLITSIDNNPDLFDISKDFLPQSAKVTVSLKEVYQNRNRNNIKW